MISKKTIDQVFQTARVEEVVGDFVTLKKSGSNFKGLSPFSHRNVPQVSWSHQSNKFGKILVAEKVEILLHFNGA